MLCLSQRPPPNNPKHLQERFKPTIPKRERPQTHTLDHAASGIYLFIVERQQIKNCNRRPAYWPTRRPHKDFDFILWWLEKATTTFYSTYVFQLLLTTATVITSRRIGEPASCVVPFVILLRVLFLSLFSSLLLPIENWQVHIRIPYTKQCLPRHRAILPPTYKSLDNTTPEQHSSKRSQLHFQRLIHLYVSSFKYCTLQNLRSSCVTGNITKKKISIFSR